MNFMKTAVPIDSELFDHITERARKSPRLRINFNFHELDDPANRMLNAIEPESYIRPPTAILNLLWTRLFLSCAVSELSCFLMNMA